MINLIKAKEMYYKAKINTNLVSQIEFDSKEFNKLARLVRNRAIQDWLDKIEIKAVIDVNNSCYDISAHFADNTLYLDRNDTDKKVIYTLYKSDVIIEDTLPF